MEAFWIAATKFDLRHSFDGPLIPTEEGEDMAFEIHARSFVENSVGDNVCINEMIRVAVRAAIVGPVATGGKRRKTLAQNFCAFGLEKKKFGSRAGII